MTTCCVWGNHRITQYGSHEGWRKTASCPRGFRKLKANDSTMTLGSSWSSQFKFVGKMTEMSWPLLLCILLFTWTNLTMCQDQSMAEQDPDLFEGDIEISEAEEEEIESGAAGAGIVGGHFRWPKRTIPYVITDVFNERQKKVILGAMEEIMENTCINLKPRKNEKDYVEFRDGPGCSSFVGREGKGKQFIRLSLRGCVQHGIVMHEIIHAIGFWHEQSRTDRDDYVNLKLENVPEEKRHNFMKYTSRTLNEMGVPYDYNSVMHYAANAFIPSNVARKGAKSIEPKEPGVHIGQRKYLSKYDIMKVNRMYCPDEERALERLMSRTTEPSATTRRKTEPTTTTRRTTEPTTTTRRTTEPTKTTRRTTEPTTTTRRTTEPTTTTRRTTTSSPAKSTTPSWPATIASWTREDPNRSWTRGGRISAFDLWRLVYQAQRLH